MNINELLKHVVEQKASDLHLTVGVPPTIRLKGRLVRLEGPPLKPTDTEELTRQVLSEDKYELFKQRGEMDVSYSAYGVGRFRTSIYQQRGTIGMVVRVISTEVPHLSKLGLPEIISKLSLSPQGIILVPGPTASGKSTTLAAMVNHISDNKPCHILTLEDPIEYLFTHSKGLINQREIGSDSESFPSALRSALRQDPDVIMIGEMEDTETISTAITAAETEHLVMGAMYAADAPQAVERLIEMFPDHLQAHVRMQLAENLVAVIVQRLLPRKDGNGMVAAVEFLVVTPSIKSLIRNKSIQQLYSVMRSGAKPGMQTIDNHIMSLYEKNLIEAREALENATDRPTMARFLSRANHGLEDEEGEKEEEDIY